MLAYIFLIIHKRKLFHRISSKFEQIHWYYWGYDDLMFSLLRSLNYLKVLELAEERRNLLQLGISSTINLCKETGWFFRFSFVFCQSLDVFGKKCEWKCVSYF